MKKILIAIFFLISATQIFAAGEDDKKDGTKLNLWIPGFIVKLAGSIVENHEGKAEGELIKKFGTVNICIREGDKYAEHTDKKVTRKLKRLDKRNYESLVKVNAENTLVDLRIRQNKKGVVKRIACIVDEEQETFVYIKMHCKLDPEEIAELVSRMNDDDLKMFN